MAAGTYPVNWGRHRRSEVNQMRVVPDVVDNGRHISSYARHIGRVGALAVALGVGVAVATGGTGLARAETGTASDSQGADAPAETSEPATQGGPAETPPSNEPAVPDAANDEDDTAPDEPEGSVVTANGIDTSSNDAGQATDTTESDDTSDDADVPDAEVVEPEPEEIPEDLAPQVPSTPTAPSNDSRPDVNEPNDSAHRNEAPAAPSPVTQAAGDEDDQETAASDTDARTVSSLMVAPNDNEDAGAAAEVSIQDPNPVQALMAVPNTIIGVATTFVAAILSPFFAPVAPAQPPLVWALLGWIQREVQRTFFNRSPHAVTDAVTTSEGTDIDIDVLDNDIDPDYSDVLGVGEVTQPEHGTVTINPDGTLTYTPDADFHGTDAFTYTVNDDASPWHVHGLLGFLGAGHDSTATVTVTVTAANEAPVARDDSATTAEDTAVVINVVANDTDPDAGDALAIIGISGASNGTVAFDGGGTTITYTPNANFNGTDTFTYTVSDGNGGEDTATVTVTVTAVNDAPVAGDDSATTDEDTPVTITVGANDSDVDGDALTVSSSAPGVTVNPDGTLTFTPAAGFNGSQSFTYTVSDGKGGTDTATVIVTVTADNTAPTITVGNPTITNADTGARTYPVTVTDPDGDAVTLTATTLHGTFVDNGDGTFTYTPDRTFVRTLAPNGSATDTITITADDGQGGITTADVTANINFVNTRPTMQIVVNEDQVTPENPVVTGRVTLSDVNGDPVTYSLIRLQRNKGTLVFDQSTGDFTFTPSEAARIAAGQPGASFNDIQVILEIAVTDGFSTLNTGVSLFIEPLTPPVPLAARV
jgi:VCBS repeat-containing protein